MIRLQSVGKRYESTNGLGGLWALRDLTLDVQPGEFVSVLGPSGCGKSTLLKVVGGLESATDGTVLVNGMLPAQAQAKRLFGFVFQHPVLFDWRTALENVRLPGEIFRDPEVLARAEECLALVNLRGFERAYPRQLSGGMQSRVALARALSFRPEILLMDEPFGSLDELTRTTMNIELLRIWEMTKATVLFVTHSIHEALFLSDRVVVLGQRPARVEAIVDVKLPRPRTLEVTEHPKFLELARELRERIGLRG